MCTCRELALFTALVAGTVVLTSCQSYEPRPLNLDEHRDAWLERSPSSERLMAFVQRLEEVGDRPTQFDPADGITLPEGEIIALVFNRDLRLARARAQVVAATAEHAGLWEDPEFGIDVLRITESVADRWIVTTGLGFTIPISGRLEAEQSRADATLRAELGRIAEAEWQTRHELRRVWLAWSADRLRVEESERLIASMDALVESTERLADAGEMVRSEASLFAIEQTQRRHELRRFRGEVDEGEQRLRTLMGLSSDAPLTLVTTLSLEGAFDDATPEAMVERNLTLVRLRDDYAVAEATLHREIRKQYPDLAIGPQYESDQGQSRIGFLGAIPIPMLNANRQGIAEAEAERELARAVFETEFERLAGDLAVARIRAQTRTAQREDLARELVPLVDRQLDDARRLLELGESGGLVLLESLVRGHATKLQLIDVRLGEALAAAELQFLIGPEATLTTPYLEEAAPDSGREGTP